MYKVSYIWLIEILTLAILSSVPRWSLATAQAAERSPEDVEAAVETWVRHVTADARQDAIIDSLEPYPSEGPPHAYIAHLAGRGFCLCGASDFVLPVYYYSQGGVFDVNNPDLSYILEEIESRTRAINEAVLTKDSQLGPYSTLLAERVEYWQDLASRRVPTERHDKGFTGVPSSMLLPLTTKWGQGAPYNNYCPIGYQGRTVVGCVATAMVQIMKYWNWPPTGTGTRSYDWGGDNSCANASTPGLLLGVDCSDSYDWNNMPDRCYSWSSATQQNAVAELSYEVGVTLNMDYGVCGSASYTDQVPGALESHFNYDTDATYTGKDIQRMTEEIQWLRPIEFRGDNGEDGHAWVVYGYNTGTDPNRQFLMNLGWGGSSDGWYTCDAVPLGLVRSQYHVIRMAPKDAIKFVGAADSGDGSPDNPYYNVSEAAAEAPSGATLIFRAGSDNTFDGASLVINRPMTIKGKDIVIRRQQ